MVERISIVPVPTAVKQYAEDCRAILDATLQSMFEGIPERDVDRLRHQLTPLLSRPAIFPDDRNKITRLIHEWQLRGHPVSAFNAMYDILKEQHREERKPADWPRQGFLRRRYPEMYAPLNPGLTVVGEHPPTLTDRIRCLLRGGTPERPAPTLMDRIQAALRS